MQVIEPRVVILTPLIWRIILGMIERVGRICYKSEDKITENSCIAFVKMLIDRGHEAMIEHYYLTVLFICDRGVTHEMVRHRVASYGQESTRYCNYGTERFGGGITVVRPPFYIEGTAKYTAWYESMLEQEASYLELLAMGSTPQEARDVLPNSLKTEIAMTANLREWRHFFRLRCAKSAHPQMRQVAIALLLKFRELIPVVFDDIEYYDEDIKDKLAEVEVPMAA